MTGRPSLKGKLEHLSTGARLKFVRTRNQLRDNGTKFCFQARNLLLRHRPIRFHINGVTFQMLPAGEVVLKVWAGAGQVRDELDLLLRLLQPGQNFLDVGSGPGLFAVAAGRKLGAGGAVSALEPAHSNRQLLSANLRLNGLPETCAIEIAKEVSAAWPSLDDLIASRKIPKPTVMRVDVAGAEMAILEGSSRLLHDADAPLLFIRSSAAATRSFGYHPVEFMWRLQECGYELFGSAPPRRPSASRPSSAPDERGRDLCPVDSTYEGMIVAAKPAHPAYPTLAVRRT
jgi:hypothetical protein